MTDIENLMGGLSLLNEGETHEERTKITETAVNKVAQGILNESLEGITKKDLRITIAYLQGTMAVTNIPEGE